MNEQRAKPSSALALVAGLILCAATPFQPGASVSFRIPDRSTAVEPSAVGLLVVGSDTERAQAAAGAVVRGLALTGPAGREIPFTTRVVTGEKDLSGDVRLNVDVIRQAWEPGWYELRLRLDEPGVMFVQESPRLRFRIGSEPILRSASVCVKADGRRMVVLEISEPILGDSSVLQMAGGTPCPNPAAEALSGREPIPRQRFYRLCPAAGDAATLRLSPPLKGEHRWSLPSEGCRELAVE